ncbi:uncharacterized protein FFB20_03607 [Fusarium fujikuroi]|nr:uncharacterized protein FFB20_03607 [Fusarium fujikuroi]SCN73462.1 uncharacterized protein FFC1_01797 [Fusarium fujikuroi]SCO07803.1 uncharacterized protein FFE2_11372 [Fusarium fujikuroi]SCO11744.1 uncharacterized protein FFM5_10099 [Fusarium fujikuroi]SCO27551.1 uncharacterized protein FFMR_00431 [Fusarium fujikuroi]
MTLSLSLSLQHAHTLWLLWPMPHLGPQTQPQDEPMLQVKHPSAPTGVCGAARRRQLKFWVPSSRSVTRCLVVRLSLEAVRSPLSPPQIPSSWLNNRQPGYGSSVFTKS